MLAAGHLAADGQTGNYCLGEWNFRCPDAQDGFDTGIIRISCDSIVTEYPAMRCTYYSNRIEYNGDNLIFDIEINGQRMNCKLKITAEGILSGKLESENTSFPIILVKAIQCPQEKTIVYL